MRYAIRMLLALFLLLATAALADLTASDQDEAATAPPEAAAAAPSEPAAEAGAVEVKTSPLPGSTVFITNHPEKRYVGKPITLSLKDADLVEVLRSFAQLGDFNLVIQPGVQGKVTAELHDVPWDQALEAILKINNLGMEISGNLVRVEPRKPRKP